jgi:hypothetical protein
MAVAGTDSLANIRPVRLVHLVLGPLLPTSRAVCRMSSTSPSRYHQSPRDQNLRRRFGRIDVVAVGRALLQDPAWLAKVRQGQVDQIADFTPEAFMTLS